MGISASSTVRDSALSARQVQVSKWPALPYKGLNFYTAEDAPLFCERDAAVKDCAELMGHFATKMLLVHGRTGTGKSSFLRAGLFPCLMNNPTFFCLRCPDSNEPAMIRSTGDPIASVMDVFHNLLSDPKTFTEIPPQAKLNARKELQCLPGATGKERAESLLKALRLITSRLPGTLVIAVDQAEEIFTLGSEERSEVRDAYFELLESLCYDRFDIKVILALRTEYYGQFADSFRIDPDLSVSTVHSGLEQYMLHGIVSSESLKNVILHPTLETSPIQHLSAPYRQYGFYFEDGLVPTIVSDVLQHCGESSTLPIVQLVCLDLYMDLRAKNETVIRTSAYMARRGVQGAIDRYFEKAISEAMGKHEKVSAKHLDAWRDVLSLLVAMQEGGALTSLLLPQSYLVEEATKFNAPEPIEATLNAMARSGMRLLRKVDLRDPETGEHAVHYSLGHDALAIPLHEWKKAQKDRLRINSARKRTREIALAGGGAAVLLAGIAISMAYAAYSSKKAAVEAILQGVETEPRIGSRILLLAAIEKNANFLDRKLLPIAETERALRTTLTRAPFFSVTAACAGFNTSGYRLALAGGDNSIHAINIQALADKTVSLPSLPPPNPDRPRQPCAMGFVHDLSYPALFENGYLSFSVRDGNQKVPLRSLVDAPPNTLPPLADFGAGLFRLTWWSPNPQGGFTQAFYDFSFDADKSRFVINSRRAPSITIRSRSGVVFSETSQFYAYTESSQDQPKNAGEASAFSNAAKASAEEAHNVRLIIGSRGAPETGGFVVNEAGADFNDPDQILPWSISFLPGDDGSLVYRNKTGRFVFVQRDQNSTAQGTSSLYQIKGGTAGLRPVPSQFSWGRPLLAAVATHNRYRVAWLTREGIRVFQSNASQELIPLYADPDAPLLPALTDADAMSRIRFSADGKVLLFAKHEYNGVTVYAWDLRQERREQIKGLPADALLSDACSVARNINYPALQDNDLRRLPESLRAQPCNN